MGRPPRSADIIEDSILVGRAMKDGTWSLACRVKSNKSLGKLTWIYAHHVVKIGTNTTYSTALQLRGLHVPEPPCDISSIDFQTRFVRYAGNDQRKMLDKTFDVAAFKRFESQRS